MTDRLNTREELLFHIRRFCEPETCAAIELQVLQADLGDRRDAEAVIRELWREGLVGPTFTEADPDDDGALFAVPEYGFHDPLGPRSRFTLTDAGYAAVEALIQVPPLTETTTSPVLVEVCSFLDARLIKYFAAHPDRMQDLTSRQFEELVAELLQQDGYDVTLTQASKDGGRDILALRTTDSGNLFLMAECKRYSPDRPVQVHHVRALYGVMERERASHAMLATTSRFTRGSISIAQDLKWRLSLRDHAALAAWLQRLANKKAG